MASFAVALGEGGMFNRVNESLVLAAVWIMTTQAALVSGFDPLVFCLQDRRGDIVTGSTEPCGTSRLLAQLGRMGIMTGTALAFGGGLVRDTLGPVFVDIVTSRTQSGALLEQECRLVIAVGVVANGTILMSAGGACNGHSFGMAACTELPRRGSKKKRLLTSVGAVTEITLALCERGMAMRLLHFGFHPVMTGSTDLCTIAGHQCLAGGTVSIMATGTLASGKGPMDAG